MLSSPRFKSLSPRDSGETSSEDAGDDNRGHFKRLLPTSLSRPVLRPAVVLPLVMLVFIWVLLPPETVRVVQTMHPSSSATSTADDTLTTGSKPTRTDIVSSKYSTNDLMGKRLFIEDYLSTDLFGSYNGQALSDMCSNRSVEWNPTIVFECPALEGGYGNVRQEILQCLRMAIAVGGSMIMPQISRRNAADVSDFRTSDMVPFGYLFDTDHFKSTLGSFCPKLKIYDSVDDLKSYPSISNPLSLTPKDLPGVAKNSDGVITGPGEVRGAFLSWLIRENKKGLSPVRIALTNRIIWTWATSADPADFARSFGGVIRIRPDARRLAGLALYNLRSRFGLPSTFTPANGGLHRDTAFVGVHLRAEKDSVDYGFTTYELQAEYYARRLREDLSGAPVVYVASGDRDMIANFSALVHPVRVAAKHNLLSETDLAGLTWDQQALIDQLVLERAAYLMGVRESSFVWTLALRRAAAINWVVGGFAKAPCAVTEASGQPRRRGCKADLAPGEYWRDDLSALVGPLTPPTTESVDVVRSTIYP